MTIEVDRCPDCGSIEISLRYCRLVAGQLEGAQRTGKCWDCRCEWSSTRTAGRPWVLTASSAEARDVEARMSTA
jgi:hypothetical protein